jgi:uncharacterized Zn-binding protein involved in type VI secretion
MPGKPAARVGDQTAHGGVITGPGVATVLIGGQPASVMGDMHACPLVAPAPPAIPHVGAAIIATAMTVLIGGKPAARVGDTVICTGPPDSIVMGCMTVLIGDGGGGGGGGGGMGQSAKAKVTDVKSEVEENHYLDVKFEDKGGNQITGLKYAVKTPDAKETEGTLTGQVKKSGLKEGNCDVQLLAIINPTWSEKKARVGDKIKLQAKVAGIESGEKASFDIFIKDSNYADHLLTTIDSTVDGDKIEAEWVMEIDEKLLADQEGKEKRKRYSSPWFYFVVKAGGTSARSKLLWYRDYIELEIKDSEGNALANKEVKLFFPDGTVKNVTLDGNGYAKVEDIPPGRAKIMADPRQ